MHKILKSVLKSAYILSRWPLVTLLRTVSIYFSPKCETTEPAEATRRCGNETSRSDASTVQLAVEKSRLWQTCLNESLHRVAWASLTTPVTPQDERWEKNRNRMLGGGGSRVTIKLTKEVLPTCHTLIPKLFLRYSPQKINFSSTYTSAFILDNHAIKMAAEWALFLTASISCHGCQVKG